MMTGTTIKNFAAKLIIAALISSSQQPAKSQANSVYITGFLQGALNAYCLMYTSGYATRDHTEILMDKAFDDFYRSEDTRAIAIYVAETINEGPPLNKDAVNCPWPEVK